jgi:hypothetical protein
VEQEPSSPESPQDEEQGGTLADTLQALKRAAAALEHALREAARLGRRDSTSKLAA